MYDYLEDFLFRAIIYWLCRRRFGRFVWTSPQILTPIQDGESEVYLERKSRSESWYITQIGHPTSNACSYLCSRINLCSQVGGFRFGAVRSGSPLSETLAQPQWLRQAQTTRGQSRSLTLTRCTYTSHSEACRDGSCHVMCEMQIERAVLCQCMYVHAVIWGHSKQRNAIAILAKGKKFFSQIQLALAN